MYGRGHQGGGGGNNVCKFYQQGRCKFGDGCKFDHPGAQRQQNNNNYHNNHNNNNNNNNRYQALENQGNAFGHGDRNQQHRPSAPGRGQQYTPTNAGAPYSITREGIELDLKNEKPTWPLSAYGPGKDAPAQLFGGASLEHSPEEMRVLHYQAAASGNMAAAAQREQELLAQSTQQVNTVLGDLDGAVKYILDSANQHPNRLDECKGSGNQNLFAKNQAPSASGFGQPSKPFGAPAQSGQFGQASTLGQTGGGGFGQPSTLGGGSGGFGQPSALGQSNVSAFGQPSSFAQKQSPFGQQQPPAGGFGQPSTLGAKPNAFAQSATTNQGSAFGQPSQIGQAGAFGQPSQIGQASAFGQPPKLGQSSAFGQPSQPGQNGAFGQPSQMGQGSAFGAAPQSSAFGQPSVPGQQNSAFGQPSTVAGNAFGQPSSTTTNAFGQPSAPAQASPFGQASAPAQQASAFGQPSVPNQRANAFGQPSAPNQQASPFGQAASRPNPPTSSPFGQPAAVNANPFGAPTQQAAPSPFGQPSQQQQTNGTSSGPNPADYITRNQNNSLRTFKGAPVRYLDNEPHYQKPDRSLERIWNPDGAPPPKSGTEDEPEAYDEAVEAAYKVVAEQGVFNGAMPEVPPKYEWIRWDF